MAVTKLYTTNANTLSTTAGSQTEDGWWNSGQTTDYNLDIAWTLWHRNGSTDNLIESGTKSQGTITIAMCNSTWEGALEIDFTPGAQHDMEGGYLKVRTYHADSGQDTYFTDTVNRGTYLLTTAGKMAYGVGCYMTGGDELSFWHQYGGTDGGWISVEFGSGGGGALSATGSDTVTVTDNGGSIFLTSRNVSASDTITITDNGATIQRTPLLVSGSDTATITDNGATIQRTPLLVFGSDTVTVTDNGGQIFLPYRVVFASDTVTVTDNGGQIQVESAAAPLSINIQPQEVFGPRVI